MARIHPLKCPDCGKVLGKTTAPTSAPFLRLWCKRCRQEVTPTCRVTLT